MYGAGVIGIEFPDIGESAGNLMNILIENNVFYNNTSNSGSHDEHNAIIDIYNKNTELTQY